MYRILFIIVLFLFVSKVSCAQDTLILSTGEVVFAKIIEVGEQELTFKAENEPNSPIHTIELSKIFMVILKNGKRETYKIDNSPSAYSQEEDEMLPTLNDETFKVKLVGQKVLTSKNKKNITTQESVNAFLGERLFTKIEIGYLVRTDGKQNDKEIQISITPNTKEVSELLWEKYENVSGKGASWQVPYSFFSPNDSSTCYVNILYRKNPNREIFSLFENYISKKYTLQDCSSSKKKILSIALLWLRVNFKKQ